jgi:hypothetical protein
MFNHALIWQYIVATQEQHIMFIIVISLTFDEAMKVIHQ